MQTTQELDRQAFEKKKQEALGEMGITDIKELPFARLRQKLEIWEHQEQELLPVDANMQQMGQELHDSARPAVSPRRTAQSHQGPRPDLANHTRRCGAGAAPYHRRRSFA